jgi:hypothetical protein
MLTRRRSNQHNDIHYNGIMHSNTLQDDIQHKNVLHNDINHNNVPHKGILHKNTQNNDIHLNDSIQFKNATLSILTHDREGRCAVIYAESLLLSVSILNVEAPNEIRISFIH